MSVARFYWLASYPKSGNTWFRIFLKNLLTKNETPISFEELDIGLNASARSWFDYVLCFDSVNLTESEIEKLKRPIYGWTKANNFRDSYYKVHDSYAFDASGRSILAGDIIDGAIYIVRNPLDVSISFAHHMSCSLDEAIEKMNDSSFILGRGDVGISNQLPQHLGTWSEHVSSWVDAPDLQCKAIRYEDMHLDAYCTFNAAASFLNIEFTNEDIRRAIRNSDISVLRRQESMSRFPGTPHNVSRFFRKGTLGDWRSNLNESQVSALVQMHEEVMVRFGYMDPSGELL